MSAGEVDVAAIKRLADQEPNAVYGTGHVQLRRHEVLALVAVVEAAQARDHASKVKVLHVLTCPECKRLEGVEGKWCDEAARLGRATLDAAKAEQETLKAFTPGPPDVHFAGNQACACDLCTDRGEMGGV